MKNALLVISSILTMSSVYPYVRDILKGKTKPNLVSWLTWSILIGLATAAEIAAHEYRAAIFTGTATVETTIILLLALRHGYVKYTRFDVICQLAVVVGLILWQIFNAPIIGVLASVTIDFIGMLPTFRHAWLKPFEETLSTYALCGIAAFVALFALESYNFISLTYAVYIVFANITIVAAMIVRRRARV